MVSGDILGLLIQSKMDTKFKQVKDYAGPMAQSNPSYFIQFCGAIAKGIIQGSTVINFVTVDAGTAGSPVVPGTGAGVGIVVDKNWFTKNLYIEIRAQVINAHGETTHPAWCDPWDAINDPLNPLPADHCSLHVNQYNPYNFLTAMCESISEAVTEHYAQFRILTSAHPTVYAGVGRIEEGGFLGISANTVASSIQGQGASMNGSFWPIMCQAIGKVYADAIMNHSTGEVVITGVCAPSSSQSCGVGGSGSGTGSAS
jgi:hypothetical protein